LMVSMGISKPPPWPPRRFFRPPGAGASGPLRDSWLSCERDPPNFAAKRESMGCRMGEK
jgi:hypothetical protein